jgi:hypothetical protein
MYLVVADQTLGGDQLREQLRERMEAGPCHFHMLVPATPSTSHAQPSINRRRKRPHPYSEHPHRHVGSTGHPQSALGNTIGCSYGSSSGGPGYQDAVELSSDVAFQSPGSSQAAARRCSAR